MATSLTQRSNSSDNKLKAQPLQPSTNTIHTKLAKTVGEFNSDLKPPSRSLDDPRDGPPKPALKGLSVRNKNSVPRDVKPLKGSNNVMRDRKKDRSNLVKKIDENDVLPGHSKNSNLTGQAKPTVKVDENDTFAYVKNAYNPMDDVCPLDEELYQRILKLDLADDGFPKFESDEPFDF